MKLCIISDSRGFLGDSPTWPQRLISLDKHNTYNILPRKSRLYSVYEQIEDLQNTKIKFDLVIIQTAYHEYICPWSIPIFKNMLGKYDPHFKDFLIPVNEGKFKGHFQYRNIDNISNTLNSISKYAKYAMYIWVPYSWPDLIKSTIEANTLYSKYFTHSIPLPLDSKFPTQYTMNTHLDKIHYNSNGSTMLSDKIFNIIKTIG